MKNTVLAGIAAFLAVFGAPATQAELIYGLNSSNQLFLFDSASPGVITTPVTITGVTSGFLLRAMDVRPATGQLYAVGTSSTDPTLAQVFVIDPVNYTATAVGGTVALTGNTSIRISVDWNPVLDRLRIVTGSTQNFRFNPNDFSLTADSSLAYATGDPNDGSAPIIIAAAYTNNFSGASSTTLYGWDFSIDNLVTIGSLNGTPNSPNSGLLFTIGGPSSFVNLSGGAGMDISTAGIAYMNVDDFDGDGLNPTETLTQVNLTNGTLTSLGQIGPSGFDLVDLAVVVPEPGSVAMVGIGLLSLFAIRARRRSSRR